MILFRKADTYLTQAEITEWLRSLRGRPFNPLSGFDVTAVFRVKYNEVDTYYFAGVNVENEELRLTSHGEEGCIAAMTTAFGKGAEIVEGWVMGARKELKAGSQDEFANLKVTCCGKCRQQIVGFAGPSAVIHSISLNGDHQQITVKEFLPQEFTFRQFVPELLNPSTKEKPTLSEAEILNKLYRKGSLSDSEILQWLQQLESIDYATQTGQAVVLKLSNDHYVAGVSVEEAAYVSINPVVSALAIANATFGEVSVEAVWTLPQMSKEALLAKKFTALAVTSDAKTGTLSQFESFKRASKEEMKEDDTYKPLNLVSLQVLGKFAMNKDIPVNLFNLSGAKKTITLEQCAQLSLTTLLPKEETKANVNKSVLSH